MDGMMKTADEAGFQQVPTISATTYTNTNVYLYHCFFVIQTTFLVLLSGAYALKEPPG